MRPSVLAGVVLRSLEAAVVCLEVLGGEDPRPPKFAHTRSLLAARGAIMYARELREALEAEEVERGWGEPSLKAATSPPKNRPPKKRVSVEKLRSDWRRDGRK